MLSVVLIVASVPIVATAQEDASTPVVDAFTTSGSSTEERAVYAWTVTTPDEYWRLQSTVPAGERTRIGLRDADGADLGRADAADRAALFDLALEPGEYEITVERSDFPFELTAFPEDERFDAEPNDDVALALPLADDVATTGRLARDTNDDDRYVLNVAAGDTQLRDIELIPTGEGSHKLCLRDSEDRDLQCRQGQGPQALTDLLLEPGMHQLHVSGTEDETASYELRVLPLGPRDMASEAEPNDLPIRATLVREGTTARGRVSRVDDDYLDFVVEGEPQLWNLEAEGMLDEVRWVRGSREVASTRPACQATSAVLEDLYLGPGRHRFMVAGCDDDELGKDDYTITLVPMGVPDPEAEREPNNDDVRAEPYRIGERKVGRLPTVEDHDVFRFTLAAPGGSRLRLAQPEGADTHLRLETGGLEVFRASAVEPGAEIEADLWLEAGDYLLTLDPRSVGDGGYELTMDRLDPFHIPVDAEPNDTFGFAREVPATLTWSGGQATYGRDADGYWLPPLETAGPATITIEGERPAARLYSDPDANDRVDLEQGEDGDFTATEAPAGVPLYLEVAVEGPYSVRLDAPGWTPAEPPSAPELEVTLTLDAETVAAYWTEAQAVSGTLTLDNQGADDLDLELELLSDHYAFMPTPESSTVMVPGGTKADVPVTLAVLPDAWSDWPVHVHAAARTVDGGLVSTEAVIEGVAGAEPVAPQGVWTVPEPLLGGLNLAAAALGGVHLGTVEPDREAFMYDGVTPAGGGFGGSIGDLPIELVVDLAGEAPVPVAGMVLNPLARGSRVYEMPRDFELLLSTDGQDWQSVLTDRAEPLPIDQHFTLETPVPATHAMLRVHALHGDGGRDFVSIGEWKVIAEPGSLLEPMPDDISDPIRGGHVAWSAPHLGGPEDTSLLDDELRRENASFDREGEGRLELVLGFHEARAAQITELRWTDPEDTRPDDHIRALEVEVSTDGPLGPWETLGWWDLARADDGSVEPFVLEAPTWARYVRLALTVDPTEVRSLELPGRIDIIERAPDQTYRSILGEWGYTSRVGPYEWLSDEADTAAALGPDAGDTLAEATAVVSGEPRSDRVVIVDDPDWYRLDVPEGDNTIEVVLEGVPAVAVELSLFDADGGQRELPLLGRTQGRERYEAVVEPGTYYLEVVQPPFNVAFTFDTSGSMGPYLDFVYEGMRAFTAGIEPGRETAVIVPFDEAPLLDDWSDQPHVLEDAVNNYVPVKESSDILSGILASTNLLAGREGTRAVLAIGDAETGTNLAPDLWAALDDVRPVIYTVHVGADSRPVSTRDMMQSWAASSSGVYDYPTTHAAMERAFERMSTQLRQPAAYTLTATSSFVDRTPASLSVVAPEGQTLGLAGGTAVALILDTSGSMNKRLDGKKRIVIAKNSMKKLVNTGLAEGLPVSLRVFGGTGKKTGCETRQLVGLGPLDREATVGILNKLKIDKKTGTPIAAALREVQNDLADVPGERVVVLVTDGKATCKEDPAEALAQLRDAGIDIKLNIVGFALGDDAVKEQMRGWAESNNGTYYDAANAQALVDAVTVAVSAPVDVYAVSDRSAPVASTTVGGDAVELEPGEYVLAVRSDPPLEIEGIVLVGGEDKTHELAVPESLTTDEEDAS